MNRLGVVAVHLLALPGALLAAVPISFGAIMLFPAAATRRAIDVQVHDTYFVVAHVHVSALVGAWVAVTTLVAFRQGTLGPSFGVAWMCLILHLSAGALGWHALGGASALLTLLASLVGLLLSLVSGLQSRHVDPV